MKLPVLAYGHRLLQQKCSAVENDSPEIRQLIKDMWETMQYANGCGLAAPQVGKALRLFIADSQTLYNQLEENDHLTLFPEGDEGIRETFINARILERSAALWEEEEGCLSIPNLYLPVQRPWSVTIEYYNQDFQKQLRTFCGTTARIIQHEYDHTEGILYPDHLKPLRRKLIEPRLKKISRGMYPTNYPMKFIH